MIDELYKKFELEDVTEIEKLDRLCAKLRTKLNLREPVSVIHYDSESDLDIKYLLEFILPSKSEPVSLQSVTRIDEDALLVLIENILVRIDALQQKGRP